MATDHEKLTLLGAQGQPAPISPERALLETFPNPYPEGAYLVQFHCPEFTSFCPMTGQPDFGALTIEYIPDKVCIESKALKLYVQSFRNERAFWERLINRIARDLVRALDPRMLSVDGRMNPRGGIPLSVKAQYKKGTEFPWGTV